MTTSQKFILCFLKNSSNIKFSVRRVKWLFAQGNRIFFRPPTNHGPRRRAECPARRPEFCLLEIPRSDVSAPRVTGCDERLAVCHRPCMRSMQAVWDNFFDLHVVTGLPRKSQACFWGNKGWHFHYLRTPFIKSAKFARVQSLLLFRRFQSLRIQTTPMNATTCAEMFSSIPNEHPAFSKIRSTETK